MLKTEITKYRKKYNLLFNKINRLTILINKNILIKILKIIMFHNFPIIQIKDLLTKRRSIKITFYVNYINLNKILLPQIFFYLIKIQIVYNIKTRILFNVSIIKIRTSLKTYK